MPSMPASRAAGPHARASSSKLAKAMSGDRSVRGGSSCACQAPAARGARRRAAGAGPRARRRGDRRGGRGPGSVDEHLRGDGLAVEALLQVVEGATSPSRTTSSSPSSTPSKAGEGRDDVGKARRDVVAGAREEPRLAAVGAICTRMPSHFHSAAKSCGIEAGESPSSIGCDSISGRNTGVLGLGRAARPSSQANSAS